MKSEACKILMNWGNWILDDIICNKKGEANQGGGCGSAIWSKPCEKAGTWKERISGGENDWTKLGQGRSLPEWIVTVLLVLQLGFWTMFSSLALLVQRRRTREASGFKMQGRTVRPASLQLSDAAASLPFPAYSLPLLLI